LVIPIVCLVRAEPKQSSEVVWTTFTNNTGWGNGVCFLTGLITPAFAFGGLDSTMHLVEETRNPKKAVSKAICYTVGMGIITAFLFTIAMVYCITDIEQLLSTPTGYV
jgi:choline transport protein